MVLSDEERQVLVDEIREALDILDEIFATRSQDPMLTLLIFGQILEKVQAHRWSQAVQSPVPFNFGFNQT